MHERDWALDRFELAGAADERAAHLPLGYQRRLAVAAALLHQPDVLFLDEPTSGIDPLARQRLWELVYELAESGIACSSPPTIWTRRSSATASP